MHPAASQRQLERSSLDLFSLSLIVSLFLALSFPVTFFFSSLFLLSQFHLRGFFVSSISHLFSNHSSHSPHVSTVLRRFFFFFFSFRLFLLAAAADAQPVLHRQIDSTLHTSHQCGNGSSSRILEFAPIE